MSEKVVERTGTASWDQKFRDKYREQNSVAFRRVPLKVNEDS
jgi:hypothetical protein